MISCACTHCILLAGYGCGIIMHSCDKINASMEEILGLKVRFQVYVMTSQFQWRFHKILADVYKIAGSVEPLGLSTSSIPTLPQITAGDWRLCAFGSIAGPEKLLLLSQTSVWDMRCIGHFLHSSQPYWPAIHCKIKNGTITRLCAFARASCTGKHMQLCYNNCKVHDASRWDPCIGWP